MLLVVITIAIISTIEDAHFMYHTNGCWNLNGVEVYHRVPTYGIWFCCLGVVRLVCIEVPIDFGQVDLHQLFFIYFNHILQVYFVFEKSLLHFVI